MRRAGKLRLRQADGVERPIICEPTAWAVALFGGKPVPVDAPRASRVDDTEGASEESTAIVGIGKGAVGP